MNAKNVATKLAGVALSAAMLVSSSAVCFATDPTTGANISQQTIPVTATIETYYEISLPAGIDTDGAIHLTREFNDYVKSAGDTTSTFYGFTSVGMNGIIAGGKKVTASLKCNNLTDGAAEPTTAPVSMLKLTADQAAKIETIWKATGDTAADTREANKVNFGSTPWDVGTTGIEFDFTSAEVNDGTSVKKKYSMLKTTLPKNGTYTSQLVIDFALANA